MAAADAIGSAPIPISHYVTSISIHSIDSVPSFDRSIADLIPILIVIAFAFVSDVLFLKHDSRNLRHSSNPVCGFSATAML